MKWSYLPPLMVYLAAGVQGMTGIVGTFYVKEHLDLSAEFLAALGFWAGIPWALKMPLGHLVDILWKFKSGLVVLGACLIAASLLIMAQLIQSPDAMRNFMSLGAWYVLATLLAPIGYVLQDAVADAMTTEAIPRFKSNGESHSEDDIHAMHVTMQTLGRVAFVGGTIFVALLNLWVFSDSNNWMESEKKTMYRDVYLYALIIPALSISGLILAKWAKAREIKRLIDSGLSFQSAEGLLNPVAPQISPNQALLYGSLLFVVFTVSIGLSELTYGQEMIFIGSLLIVTFLMRKITSALDIESQKVLFGTAIVIFCFRATPSAGPGVNWWSIDVLGFDQLFFSWLALIGSVLSLIGMYVLRARMAKHSIIVLTLWLTLAGAVLSIPQLAMSYGFHQWASEQTNGLINARFIAIIDTALESPLGQIAMIPLLTWIAQSAPKELKATYFAVMTSFANLALSASQLLTKYLNQIFTINRETKDALGQTLASADYSELSALLTSVMILGLLIPIAGIAIVKMFRLKCA